MTSFLPPPHRALVIQERRRKRSHIASCAYLFLFRSKYSVHGEGKGVYVYRSSVSHDASHFDFAVAPFRPDPRGAPSFIPSSPRPPPSPRGGPAARAVRAGGPVQDDGGQGRPQDRVGDGGVLPVRLRRRRWVNLPVCVLLFRHFAFWWCYCIAKSFVAAVAAVIAVAAAVAD